jgi:hypothetical protein
MERRAESHVERCEHALHDRQDSPQNDG